MSEARRKAASARGDLVLPAKISRTALGVTPIWAAMESTVAPPSIKSLIRAFQSIGQQSTGYCSEKQQHSATELCEDS